jgi:hypothetical protein
MSAEPFFSITIPGHKAEKDLGANTNASWRTIHRKRQADKKLVAAILMNSLNRMGLTGEQFLTNLGQYPIEDCLPVHVTFKRYYTGKAKQWDEDNLYSAYKPAQDALKTILGVDDKHFKTTVEQIRDDFTELEIIIAPAWALVEVAK